MQVLLLTPFYKDKQPKRYKELLFCLKKNLSNPIINRVVAVTDTQLSLPYHQKLTVVNISRRQTYRTLFDLGYTMNPDGINIVCNADIYWEKEDVKKLLTVYYTNTILALSRWDVKKKGKPVHYALADSQDSWVFKGKVNFNDKADAKNFGEEEIQLGRAGCLSGETTVLYNRGKRNGGRKISISELYSKFNDIKCGNPRWKIKDLDTYIQSYNSEQKSIIYNKILAVIQSGVKPTIKITFEDNSHIILTVDHPILNSELNYVRADRLVIGDSVMAKGSINVPVAERKRKYSDRKVVYIKHHPFAEIKTVRGHKYKRIRRYRLVYEAEMNKMEYGSFVECLRTDPIRSRKLMFLEPSVEVHHKDGNTLNDSIENLEAMGKADHARVHGFIRGFNFNYTTLKKITSIEKNEQIMTYDIKMASPHNNFCANNIIVHNCDNVIAYALQQNYTVLNPSRSIKSYHLHLSEVRNYKNKKGATKNPYQPPYYRVPVCQYTDKKIKKVLHVGINPKGQTELGKTLASFGEYHFFDWQKIQKKKGVIKMHEELIRVSEKFNPDFTFMQIQTPDVLDQHTCSYLKGFVLNWTGDVRHEVPSWMKDLGRYVDATCFTNETDVRSMQDEGFNSMFLQIGFENTIFKQDGVVLSDKRNVFPHPEIVFMGNHYGLDRFPLSTERYEIAHLLKKTYKSKFLLCGQGWDIDAVNLMGRAKDEAMVYRSCKIAINANHFIHERFSSDRIFRIMGSGAFCLTRWYPGVEKDFVDGVHLRTFKTLEEMVFLIDYYLKNDAERMAIADAGCELVHSKYRWQNNIDLIKRIASFPQEKLKLKNLFIDKPLSNKEWKNYLKTGELMQ